MDFQLEFGFYSYASNAAFWCFRFFSTRVSSALRLLQSVFFLRKVLLVFLGSSLSFQCSDTANPKDRT